jgi:hypothetical protein
MLALDSCFDCSTIAGEFVAFTGATRPCAEVAWSSSFFVARTSERRFHSLLQRSHLGDVSPYSNGEQDVLDAEFPPPCRALATAGYPHDNSWPSSCSAAAVLRPRLAKRPGFEQVYVHDRFYTLSASRARLVACQMYKGVAALDRHRSAAEVSLLIGPRAVRQDLSADEESAMLRAMQTCCYPTTLSGQGLSAWGDTSQGRYLKRALGLQQSSPDLVTKSLRPCPRAPAPAQGQVAGEQIGRTVSDTTFAFLEQGALL